MINITTFRWLAAACVVLTSAAGYAADHREAPLIQGDSRADINDVYVFRNPGDSSKLVLAMTVNPFSAPSEAVTYHFDSNVRYRFNIDNDGDALADRHIDVSFSPAGPGGQTLHAVFPGGISVSGNATPPTEDVAPIDPVINSGPDGIRVFAGPRDDPFFFDVVGFNRFLTGTGGFTGSDGFAGVNVSAIVIELPVSMVANGGSNLQIWAETDRRLMTRRKAKGDQVEKHFGPQRQIERMGNPAINTALIPAGMKDRYNTGKPHNDAADYAGSIVASLTSLGTDATNIGILASVAVPDTLKMDLSGPDGFPGGGRRLDDDVIDTLFFFIFNQTEVPDGVDANDKDFLGAFPYLAAPHQPL